MSDTPDTDTSDCSHMDDDSEHSEDCDDSEYNRKEIKTRLQFQENEGHKKVNLFSTEIKNAIQLSLFKHCFTHISNKLLNIILTYSNHQQIIDKWHNICYKLGPFSYLLWAKGSIDHDILQFEKKLSTKYDGENKLLSSSIRISLMICNGMGYTLFNDSKSRECVVDVCENWEFVENDTMINDEYYSKYKCNDDGTLKYPLNIFFNGLEQKSDDERMSYVVNIGCFAWNDVGSVALWNTFNNKVCVDTSYGVHMHGDCGGNWANEAVGFFVYDFDEWFMQTTDWYKMFTEEQLVDVDDESKFFKNQSEWREYMYRSQKMSYMMYEDGYSNQSLCDLYLVKMYQKRYNPLVYGYVKRFKCIPICLTELILSFFPFFVPLSG